MTVARVGSGCRVARLLGGMKRFLAFALLFVAATAFAHGGHQHQFLGTVKALTNAQLVITTTAGKDAEFLMTSATAVTRDGSPVARTELTSGRRVAVYVANDGKTAVSVKVGR